MTPPLAGLRSVLGQPHAVAVLLRALAGGHLAGSYLFDGADGVGKERTARALVQASVCTTPRDDGDACSECPSCRQVAAGTYVDLLTLAREVDVRTQQVEREPKTELTIDKVRALQSERLIYQPFQSSRWVIIRNAHELNEESSNALLKTLEEPPTRTHFVLVTPRPSTLLTTIRSRCQRVRFGLLDDSIVESVLRMHGVAEPLARDAAAFADGSVSRALSFCEGDVLVQRRAWVDRIVGVVDAGRAGPMVDLAEDLKRSLDKSTRERDEVIEILLLLQRRFRDDAIARLTEAPTTSVRAAARADATARALASMSGGVNTQMALESLWIRLSEATS